MLAPTDAAFTARPTGERGRIPSHRVAADLLLEQNFGKVDDSAAPLAPEVPGARP